MIVVEMATHGKAVSPVFTDERPFIGQIKIAISSSGLIDDEDFEKAKEAAKQAVAESLGATIAKKEVAK